MYWKKDYSQPIFFIFFPKILRFQSIPAKKPIWFNYFQGSVLVFYFLGVLFLKSTLVPIGIIIKKPPWSIFFEFHWNFIWIGLNIIAYKNWRLLSNTFFEYILYILLYVKCKKCLEPFWIAQVNLKEFQIYLHGVRVEIHYCCGLGCCYAIAFGPDRFTHGGIAATRRTSTQMKTRVMGRIRAVGTERRHMKLRRTWPTAGGARSSYRPPPRCTVRPWCNAKSNNQPLNLEHKRKTSSKDVKISSLSHALNLFLFFNT